MKIAIEKKIPYIADALIDSGDLVFLEASEFTREVLRRVEVIIVRTTVKCDAALLEGTSVRLILTATIGYDHIDTGYCQAHDIVWKNAPGCNADSVVQYFLSALAVLGKTMPDVLPVTTVGVIGCGNVGSRVVAACRVLGVKVLMNDPPLQQTMGCSEMGDWSTLEEIADLADIITVHTPLIKEGDSPTYHLLSERFFDRCKKQPVVINAARGGVVDESALLAAYEVGRVGNMVIDCWEGEPIVNRDLLQRSVIHTPHIAGYSADGKANATRMCLEALRSFGYQSIEVSRVQLPVPSDSVFDCSACDAGDALSRALLYSYDIRVDSERLGLCPDQFRRQRDEYPFRREAKAYIVEGVAGECLSKLEGLGFQAR